jgi:hypothetical protein
MTSRIKVTQIIVKGDGRNPRQRTRLVAPVSIGGELVLNRFHQELQLGVSVWNGGGVANKYGYPAFSECAAAIVHADGRAVVSYDTIAANKITYSGSIAACFHPGLSPLVDGRYRGDGRKTREALRDAWREAAAIWAVCYITEVAAFARCVERGAESSAAADYAAFVLRADKEEMT